MDTFRINEFRSFYNSKAQGLSLRGTLDKWVSNLDASIKQKTNVAEDRELHDYLLGLNPLLTRGSLNPADWRELNEADEDGELTNWSQYEKTLKCPNG